MILRTGVVGVGHLGNQHARIHAELAREGHSQFVAVCDIDEPRAKEISRQYNVAAHTDWRNLIGKIDAVSLAVPTELHAEIGCALLAAGIHLLVEKPIARTLDEADTMIAGARQARAILQVGHAERFNPAMIALRPHVRSPVYFEIHRVGQFTARSLDIDVVLDLMIHDLDIVQSLVGPQVEVTNVHAVGIPILTNRVDAANARIEFATGAVANITASRVGTEKIRKMRFFQPRDYVVLDYANNYASISNLSPSSNSPWPGVRTQVLEVKDVEPLRAEIESFFDAIANSTQPIVSGEDGRRALSLAIRTLAQIHEHTVRIGAAILPQ
ncbi:MAG TPA: Gfo/Idh/MocA family oxidoreductase [Pyrinomonadaceae bacterium]|jgi:predicted dehydrogenase|nr:Gfo/Idh/MocA family oxidoreductase [Pyrinomonadaceae bacterium]